ncbi:uncharacterized protein LOC142521929 [Primulina tabacum]|uniref:uncharacterized protein LOC142521929 n=1 Tax=Primulina tabacum TaxID=48773 RepID=UPI003F59902C
MISGGSTDGDSNRAHKSRSRRDCMEVEEVRRNEAVIIFGPKDLKCVNLPHNDTMIIKARVANYDIMRVFVDLGRSVNVIFKEALIQMDLQGYHLEAVDTTIFGFAGHAVYPEGEIVLPLSLGTGEPKKKVMTTFTVVDATSLYNIIFRLPTMNELRVVASTYHQKIKFPVGSQVGEVWGDQPSSCKCYVEAVRVNQKRARKEGKKVKGCEKMDRVVEKGEVHFVAEDEQEVVEIGPGVGRDLTPDSGASVEHPPGISTCEAKEETLVLKKDKVIDVHVKDLLKAGHIREIQFSTWLSNMVLVPKSTGKWRMCVDFRDLNKACPKDHYPLPKIDQLVDSTSGYELLSFMVAYQRYHQITLAKNGQDKAIFITSGGTFCYVVMPFG